MIESSETDQEFEDQDQEGAYEGQEEDQQPQPIESLLEEVSRNLLAAITILEKMENGEALFHTHWPAISNQYDDLTRALRMAGMVVNKENNPIYVELAEHLKDFFAY